jgi:membrane protease YdiL (CAAX protease family)
MQTGVLALLLASVFGFFLPAARNRLQSALHRRPALVWAVPFFLTSVFAGAALLARSFSPPLISWVFCYASAPVLCAWLAGTGPVKKPGVLDFLAILLLWLPIEFGAGAGLVPRGAQGFLHSVAYGIAILLGLTLFLGFRPFPGMKYNLPRRRRDLWLPLAGFALLAPVLMAVGIFIGFLAAPHWPVKPAGAMAGGFGVILAATALPEEILFRSLIQNLLMLRFGESGRTLLLASLIFGCAHLDNGPQALPNWRYAILATIAGWAYGKVFQKSSTVLSSAGLHALVDWTKHFVF